MCVSYNSLYPRLSNVFIYYYVGIAETYGVIILFNLAWKNNNLQCVPKPTAIVTRLHVVLLLRRSSHGPKQSYQISLNFNGFYHFYCTN